MSYLNDIAIQFGTEEEMNNFINEYTSRLEQQEKNSDLDDKFTHYSNYFQSTRIKTIENDGEPVVNFGMVSFYPGDSSDAGAKLLLDMAREDKFNVLLIRIGEQQDDIEVISEKQDFFSQPICLGINIYKHPFSYAI